MRFGVATWVLSSTCGSLIMWSVRKGHGRGDPTRDRWGDPLLKRVPHKTGADGEKLTETEARRFALVTTQAAVAGDKDAVLAGRLSHHGAAR